MKHCLFLLAVLATVTWSVGCDPKPAPTNPTPPAAATPKIAPPQGPAKGHGDEDAHGGNVVELGNATAGEFTLRATRDAGEIKPGGDAPIDVWVTTADGKPATVAVVRFWIGLEDAKLSRKAKADIEDPKQPNHWHTHAEVPEPLMPEAKLWVEVEVDQKSKLTASFDLKA